MRAVTCLSPRAQIERDWHSDVAGKPALDRADFCRSFFQLADVHTDDISAPSYAALIQNAARGIVASDGTWRDDASLLRRVRERAGPRLDAVSFGAGVREWARVFGIDGLETTLGLAASCRSSRASSARGSRLSSLAQPLFRPPGHDEWDPAVNVRMTHRAAAHRAAAHRAAAHRAAAHRIAPCTAHRTPCTAHRATHRTTHDAPVGVLPPDGCRAVRGLSTIARGLRSAHRQAGARRLCARRLARRRARHHTAIQQQRGPTVAAGVPTPRVCACVA